MYVPNPSEMLERFHQGEFNLRFDPNDEEYIISGQAARDDRLAEVNATIQRDRALRGSSDMAEGQVDTAAAALPGYSYLAPARLAPEGEEFTPFLLIKKYPYLHIPKKNQQRVAERYFDKGQIYEYTWDFFYVHRLKSQDTQDTSPIILVPTLQFEELLGTINVALGVNFTIPPPDKKSENKGDPFRVNFEYVGTPCPRYLGRAGNSYDFDGLKHSNIWPIGTTFPGEPPAIAMEPTDSSVKAFIAKVELMMAAQKAKNKANKEEAQKSRIQTKKEWGSSIKRVQRYVALRPARGKEREEPTKDAPAWDKCVPAPKVKAPIFKADEIAPFDRKLDVVFVCIDVEAWEGNNHLITEIGMASIDTRDLATEVPGENGENLNWFKHIHARHFRIEEYKTHVNRQFLTGCPDKFGFGESEFVREVDRIPCVESCLKEPFCKRERDIVRTPETDMKYLPKRNVVLVGHDIQADIKYCKDMGYDISRPKVCNMLETIDTRVMFQYLARDSQPTSLAKMLASLRIKGWYLHNAGNDAVYTLRAMLGIAIQHLTDKAKAEEKRAEFELAKKSKIEEAKVDAEAAVKDQFQGWSSAGEGSDGGDPVRPSIGPVKVKNKSRSAQAIQNTPAEPQSTMTSVPQAGSQAGSQVNNPVSGAGLGAAKTTANGEPYVFPHLRYLKKKTSAWEDETPAPTPSRQGATLLPTSSGQDEAPSPTPPEQDEDFITFPDQDDEGDKNMGARTVVQNTASVTVQPKQLNNKPLTTTNTTSVTTQLNNKPPNTTNTTSVTAQLNNKPPTTTARETAPKPSNKNQDECEAKVSVLKRRLELTNPRTTAWKEETEEQATINNALAEASLEEMKKRLQHHTPAIANAQAANTTTLAGPSAGKKGEPRRRTTAWEDEPQTAGQTTNASANLSLEDREERTNQWVSGSSSASTSTSGWGEGKKGGNGGRGGRR